MKVYTKTGDGGQTSLLSKERVAKDNVRVNAYGTIDEASAAMGLARALCDQAWAVDIIRDIQQQLILLNADLATNDADDKALRIQAAHVSKLEAQIDALEAKRVPQPYFITSGDSVVSAALDLARTIVRRSERLVVTLKRSQHVPDVVSLYLNRLSDLLYVLARCLEQQALVELVTAKVKQALAKTSAPAKPAGIQAADVMEQAGKIVAAGQNSAKISFLAVAARMMAAAEAKAAQIGVPMVVAVVDAGGNLVAQHRMDGALLGSISLALDKAYTAAALQMPTHRAADLALPGQSLFGINSAADGRFIVFGGGLPLVGGGQAAGGIGVSGGSVEQDIAVAQAGLTAWQALTDKEGRLDGR